MPLPARITPRPGMLHEFDRLASLPVNKFSNKLAPNVPNKIASCSPFFFFFA